MSKAFDSVGMKPLFFTLKRINLPDEVVNFIINLFKDRSITIITKYGNSDKFTAGDGIVH